MSGADSRRAPRTTLLADANVLIDYRDARDLAILSLVTEHLGPLVVVSTVLDEVRKLETEDCARLGIGIVEATTKQLLRAGRLEAPVSFNDRVCFVVCLDGRWTCVTNDRALRQLCQEHGVSTRFGLRLLLDLAAVGAITRVEAAAVARRIQARNPFHINDRVVGRLLAALDRVSLN